VFFLAAKGRRITEVLVMIALMLGTAFWIPELKGLISLVPILYFFVERAIRKDSAQQQGGFRIMSLAQDLRSTWGWVLLVAVGMQAAFLLIFKYFSPETLAHIQDRLPSGGELTTALIAAILIGPLGEEIAYRGLFQERFGWMMPQWAAIVTTSALFALMHFTAGPSEVVFWDLLGVCVDSLIYGIIYAKTRNIYASYIAHLLADSVALTSLFMFL
jgi:uncharacterized protein